MLDERKAAILRTVVEEYIETAQPVGSGHVAAAPGLRVSPATVRNDMAALEHDGYLRQPHTSAGRVPTEKGYRYFVDTLAEPARLESAQVEQVRSFFATAHGELEQMLHDTSRLLADLTDYAAVVIGPPAEPALVRSVHLVGLTPLVALVVVVLANGVIEKRTIDLREDTDDERLATASTRLAAHGAGRPLADLGEMAPSGAPALDDIVARVTRALAVVEPESDHVYVRGTARMAAAFDAVETVRSVLAILEQQYVVVTVLRDVIDRGQQVAIGSETGLETLAECSLVVAPYDAEGERAGTIGVLGPTRMNYPQALAAVAVVSKRLGRRLREG